MEKKSQTTIFWLNSKSFSYHWVCIYFWASQFHSPMYSEATQQKGGEARSHLICSQEKEQARSAEWWTRKAEERLSSQNPQKWTISCFTKACHIQKLLKHISEVGLKGQTQEITFPAFYALSILTCVSQLKQEDIYNFWWRSWKAMFSCPKHGVPHTYCGHMRGIITVTS